MSPLLSLPPEIIFDSRAASWTKSFAKAAARLVRDASLWHRAICQTYRLWRIKRTSATPLLKRVSERLARTFFRLTARSLSIFPPDDAGTGPELRRRATGHNRGSSRPLVWGVGAGSWRRIASRPSAVLRRPLGWAKNRGRLNCFPVAADRLATPNTSTRYTQVI